jgi:hypothetical protein
MHPLRGTHQRGRAGGALAPLVITAVLAGCGGVAIKPQATLPKPLIATLPARIGLVNSADMKNYTHKETRWGVDWAITLGPGNARLWTDAFRAEFRDVELLNDTAAIATAKGLGAAFEPRIEQYSFATARETGGDYCAVTIRYRLNVYAPDGKLADSLTLTGYGNSAASALQAGPPLEQASRAAMRDAAAKFLVQFADLALAKTLAKGEPLVADVAKTVSASVGMTHAVTPEIEAVPIEESDTVSSAAAPVGGASAAPAPAKAAPPPSGTAPAVPAPTSPPAASPPHA